MASPPPPGIYVPVPTFFLAPTSPTDQGALDLDTQAEHALHIAQSGAAGLVLLGSTGEAVHLTRSERTRLIAAVRAKLSGFAHYPLLAGTASQSVAETLELLADAAGAGADFGLVLAPGYFAAAGGVGEPALVAWYTAIADQSALPIMV